MPRTARVAPKGNATLVALGGALVVPIGLLRRLRGEPPAKDGSTFSVDADARVRIERLAMDAVRRDEEACGHSVVDVSAQKMWLGPDI